MAITNMGEMQYLVIGDKKYSIPMVDVSGKVDATHTDTSSTYGTINSSIGYGEALLGTDSGGYGPRLEATSVNSEFTSYLQIGQGWTDLVSKSTSVGQQGEAGITVSPTGPYLYANDSYIMMDSSMISLNASAVLVPTPTSTSHAATKGYVDDSNRCWYGTCSTTASTAAKVVTCSGFTKKAGAIIGILFSTANTAATPTLNINSTTAASIYVGSSTPSSTANVLKWSANTMVYFMYDGTYYRYITSVSAGSVASSRGANTWYGTSNTTASTQAKTSTIDNYVLTKGSIVSIYFSTANTYTSAKITLNINSTGAKDVYHNGTVTSSSNTVLWDANSVVTFMYDGTGYQYLGSSRDTALAGTVTSVGLTNATNGGLTISGSPVTSSGSITIGLDTAYGDTKNPYGSKTANYILAAPNGSAGVPSFRALVAADIPDLSGTYVPVTQTGDASGNSLLPSTTTITIDPNNTGSVIQCTSTQDTELSQLNMGPWGASLQAGTPGEMGLNATGYISVGTNYNLIDLGGYGTNGFDNITCQGGEIGLTSTDANYTAGTNVIINPTGFNVIRNISDSATSVFNIDETSGVANVPLYVQEHYDTTTSTISLGKYFASGGITSSGGTTFFSFPTGRVFPSNYEIKSFSCTLLGRAANANGTGYYFIKSSSGGTGAVTFNYKSSFSMYNANNASKTVTAAMQTVELEGGTNIAVNLIGGTDDFFSGTSTIRGYINNQPCIFTLQNIQFTVGPAS